MVEVSPTEVSSSSSSEILDYLGDDLNWDNIRLVPDSSKFSHLATEDMKVTSMKGKLSLHYTSVCRSYRYVLTFSLLDTFSETWVIDSDKATTSVVNTMVKIIHPEPEAPMTCTEGLITRLSVLGASYLSLRARKSLGKLLLPLLLKRLPPASTT